MIFTDREEAGCQLANQLAGYSNLKDVVNIANAHPNA
jgi:predicted phosphoribosyltransferase